MTAGRRLARRAATAALLGALAVALAVSALLAVLRTTGPPGRRGIELVALTPLGLPLAGAALVLALLLVLRSRRLALVAAAAALVVGGLHAWWLAPLYVGASPAAAAGPELVVMTQNFEDGDAAALAALVRRHDVDVLVLTDSPSWQVEEVRAAGLRRALPYTTRDHGNGSVVLSRFRITDDARVSDGGDSRSMVLHVPDLGRVHVVAVHPTPPYQDGGRRWATDWQRILDRLEGRRHGGGTDPLVVLGDFNATRDHAPVRALEEMGLRDSGEVLNRGVVPTWPANGWEERLGVQVPAVVPLDHVLTGPGLVPVDLVVSDAALSDHRAVIVTLVPAAG